MEQSEKIKKVVEALKGKLAHFTSQEEIFEEIKKAIKIMFIETSDEEAEKMAKEIASFGKIQGFIDDAEAEDIVINATDNIFVYKKGKVQKFEALSQEELELTAKKMMMYSISEIKRGIYDIHLPNGSRANITESPRGYEIAIRNFRKITPSIIDLINLGTLDYSIAAKLWLYADGFGIRPANILIGGMPGSGKTTLLNSMFSFFKPEERVIVIEDTLELNTSMLENCVRLETTKELTLEDLVKNVLRMRPDRIIIGEVRGREAIDMMTAMNIGKIGMGTIHGSTARDIVVRLQNAPMNVPKQIIPLIDSIIIISKIFEKGITKRKIIEIAEVSGIETEVLLNPLYKYDFKQMKAIETSPSVTYRDTLAKVTGISTYEITKELERREEILKVLNKNGIHKIEEISKFVKEYYEDPYKALKSIGI
ncbi:MAG: CpaF family protein, partial [Candidatus Micrarchaeia archaeon]